MPDFDCIVIGLGGMGSAAAYALARRGARVLGLEQFDPVHERGSSHGQTRIIRQAYFEHPDYVPLLRRAYALWRELEQECDERLFIQTGLLLVGAPDGAVISGVRRAAAAHALNIDEICGADFPRRFPGFRVPAGAAALYEPQAGYLRVEACVAQQQSAAERGSAVLRFREPVLAWSADSGGVMVTTGQGRYTAARLVVCGGAWAAHLLAELALPLRVLRRVQFWFGCNDALYSADSGVPAFCFDTPAGFFYGFPALPIERGVMKIAQHAAPGPGHAAADRARPEEAEAFDRPVADPAEVSRALDPRDAPPVQAFIRDCLTEVNSEVLRYSVCLYTMTPDQHFLIDRHPRHDRVYLAAGFSGHGFKFCPVIGEVLADLALAGQTEAPVGFLGLRRLELCGNPPAPENRPAGADPLRDSRAGGYGSPAGS